MTESAFSGRYRQENERALTDTTGQPVDVGVLQEVGTLGPVGSPRHEPDHLLPTSIVVDDGSSRGGGEGAIRRRSKSSHLLGKSRVDDGGWVVPETLCAHTSTAACMVSRAVLRDISRLAGTHVLMLAVGKSVVELMLTSCSTPVLQHPAFGTARVTPRSVLGNTSRRTMRAPKVVW